MHTKLRTTIPGEVYQLGQPQGVQYARKGGLLVEQLAGVVIFILTIVPALLFLSLPLLIIKEAKPASIAGYEVIGGGFGLMAYLSGRFARRVWREWGVIIVMTPKGLAYWRGRTIVLYRWEDIEQFRCLAVDHLVSTVYVYTRFTYQFRHRDGHRFRFREQIDREHDQSLADMIERGLLDQQLPMLRERVAEGQAVRFNPFAIDRESLQYKKMKLPYTELEYIWIEKGRLRVRKRGKILNWCNLRMDQISNCCVLLELVRELSGLDKPSPGGAKS